MSSSEVHQTTKHSMGFLTPPRCVWLKDITSLASYWSCMYNPRNKLTNRERRFYLCPRSRSVHTGFNPNHQTMSHKQITQDWKVEISCSQREVGGSFSVFIFLGDIPADPTQWLFDPAFAGTFDIYTYSSDTSDESHSHNEEEGGNSIVNGSVHLNRAILRRQQSLEEDAVLSFLRRKLNWGVQKVRNGSSTTFVVKFSNHYFYTSGGRRDSWIG
jgi:hypothetical protein